MQGVVGMTAHSHPIEEAGNQEVGASALPTGLSSASPIEPASPSRPEASIPSRDDIQAVYDCIILSCQHTGYHARGATALRTISALADQRGMLLELIADIEESLTADNTYRQLREACQALLAEVRGAA